MKHLWQAFRLIWSAAPISMWQGAIMAVMVALMGTALLGLSGWFITATATATAAGVTLGFKLFGPRAAVRLLALGRAGARYGERVLTHDATLKALSKLRVSLMRRLSRLSLPEMQRLRGPLALTRITADVDALDGIVLRLALPVIAGVLTHVAVFFMLWMLVAPSMAIAIAVGYVGGGAVVLIRLTKATFGPSRTAERANQAMRRDTIGMMRGRADLFLQGQVQSRLADIQQTESEMRSAMRRLDEVDRRSGLILSVVIALVSGGALALGGQLIATGAVSPAHAAIGFFVAVALGETIMPLRRGIAEIGRIRDAAERVLAHDEQGLGAPRVGGGATGSGLSATGVGFSRNGADAPLLRGVDLEVNAGETVALVGPSGSGKSTLLAILAGTEMAYDGEVRIAGQDLRAFGERELRGLLTLVPQRSALVSGSILANLSLAKESLSRDEAEAVLQAVQLDRVVENMGGLDAELGESGGGLSGGETRRLVLARALLRHPKVLLLDEPTEGLDTQTAKNVLEGIRGWLPEAAIITASHRETEIAMAQRVVTLTPAA
ncbi:ATP-binding cassette domain-containing protein [Shimia sp. CNT1-13L.2]|uniref:amino acid ABC transporter ATP-binding/permease protein n=1 Tax=Shimia sp. CNT1-13L.2 TaxID=2959663 RepID=UPI0020CF0BBB|nr:ATP-binding cassette domain-containing protein [Shimia sp. CNT1-13L.2]MCP9483601.1 ATP-binding cassette domain-containing protein [Shimia sp. CNT1-13L.2]